jgi:two-component system chemotaxis sensor kinase CheA
MDVVRANIEKIGGSLQIFSTPGSDTRIMLYLPLTLSIVPAITVSVGDQRFAIPRSYIDEIFHIGSAETELVRAGGQTMITLRDQRFACADLGEVLELQSTPIKAGRSVVLIQLMAGEPFALTVDRVLDHQDLVIKPIAPIVMQSGVYVGTTQLDDGSPVLMLDAPKVGERAGLVRGGETGTLRQVEGEAQAARVNSTPVLLFVGLDGVRRAVNMNVVGRFEEVEASAVRGNGQHAQIVIQDEILPIAGLGGAGLPTGPLAVFRLSDGSCEVIYALREMVDTSVFEGDLIPAPGADLAAGIALIDGEPYEVLDSLALFARYARPAAPARQPLCRMPAGDRWLQDFLRPLVEAAGYGVIDEADEAEADVSIALADTDAAAPLAAAQAILLRATPEPDTHTAQTIYRYDRDALMAALNAAKARKRA